LPASHSGQEHPPCDFEIGAGLLEGRGGVGADFARTRARIEAAVPFPLIGVVRIADALGDRGGFCTAFLATG